MLRFTTRVRVDGIRARDIFDFLANPDDTSYRQWWPGTHLRFHVVSRRDGHVGDVVFMDEYIGDRRLRMHAVVLEAEPGRRLAWRMKKGATLPAKLTLDLADYDGGVAVTHTTEIGFRGLGRALDPLFGLYFSKGLARALDEHVRTEFPLLRDLIGDRQTSDERGG